MPFVSDDCVCFYNGEIYNYRRWATDAKSDGEAIIPAYRDAGSRCFELFDGEFAATLWDGRVGQLMLARDLFGTKPLYFAIEHGALFWASSESAVAHLRGSASICMRTTGPTYRHAFAIQEPYTSFDGVWSLPPGHCLTADGDTVRMYRYCAPVLPCRPPSVARFADALASSLASRMEHTGVVGIPMSGGIDSGIIAFTAERLGIDYEIFSVVRMFGQPTPETDAIMRRADRLRGCRAVHLLSCDEDDYRRAMTTLFSPGYYASERFDSGAIGLYVVLREMARRGIRVALDGTGGDELFHGYIFRNEYRRPDGWPPDWEHSPNFYSLWTTLLDYTSKVDQAGGYWSIETRFPFQTREVLRHALSLPSRPQLKWPLRQYLAERCDYGPTSVMDREEKYGFSLKHRPMEIIVADMKRAWLSSHGLRLFATRPARPFPFAIGEPSSLRLR